MNKSAAATSKQADLEHEVLAKLGNDNQRARYKAGVLPEDELASLARGELFKPFDRFERWKKIARSEVRHESSCPWRAVSVKFETCEVDELSHGEWDALAEIKAAAEIARDHHWAVRSASTRETTIVTASHGARNVTVVNESEFWPRIGVVIVEPLTHWASCSVCKAEIARSSAKVSILWAGRTLVREYAL